MKQEERVSLYNAIFSTDDGEKLLDDLKKQHYINITTYSSQQDTHSLAYKEGQREVVLRILRVLNKTKGDK